MSHGVKAHCLSLSSGVAGEAQQSTEAEVVGESPVESQDGLDRTRSNLKELSTARVRS